MRTRPPNQFSSLKTPQIASRELNTACSTPPSPPLRWKPSVPSANSDFAPGAPTHVDLIASGCKCTDTLVTSALDDTFVIAIIRIRGTRQEPVWRCDVWIAGISGIVFRSRKCNQNERMM